MQRDQERAWPGRPASQASQAAVLDGERVRQRRWRAGRAALAARPVDGRSRREAAAASWRGGCLGFLAHRTHAPWEQPCARSQLLATGAGPARPAPPGRPGPRRGPWPGGADTRRARRAGRGRSGRRWHRRRTGNDVLGRLQPAIVGQHHQVPGRDRRVGGEQQRRADVARPPGPEWSAAPGVKRRRTPGTAARRSAAGPAGSTGARGIRADRRTPGRAPPGRGLEIVCSR